jgi:hypothetical protein
VGSTGLKLRILTAVKTYPIPSAKYDELVCTAGVTERGDFIRLYPINFRELPYAQKYHKYQWMDVVAEKHRRDPRKESYRPEPGSIRLIGEPIPTRSGDWSGRARYVLRQEAPSMEDLRDRQEADRTSLGIFRPKEVTRLIITPDDPEWKAAFQRELQQQRLFEDRKTTLAPPRKVPWKFQYEFVCDDPRCKGHRMMIEDWEVGALYWKLVDTGATPREAAGDVEKKFLNEICAPDRDTRFFVGTILAHPKSWVVIGLFWPKRKDPPGTQELFR